MEKKCESTHDGQGREIPDPTPVEMPLGYEHPPSIQQMIAAYVGAYMASKDEEYDTWEEADDLDMDDEENTPVSGHEFTQMQEERLRHDRIRAGQPKDERIVEEVPVDERVKGRKSKGKPKVESVDEAEDEAEKPVQ